MMIFPVNFLRMKFAPRDFPYCQGWIFGPGFSHVFHQAFFMVISIVFPRVSWLQISRFFYQVESPENYGFQVVMGDSPQVIIHFRLGFLGHKNHPACVFGDPPIFRAGNSQRVLQQKPESFRQLLQPFRAQVRLRSCLRRQRSRYGPHRPGGRGFMGRHHG